ncbi:MAG TPA: hypothetical protein VG144_04180 [Gaiellaceae bacterium]|nr:hypothetical protein [Gaiellaceae bacterium]
MSEPSDDLLEPESSPSPADLEDDERDEDDPGLSAEESLGLLPPD